MDIIHIDMDAFYAAVEMRDAPSLAGQPVIIGSLPGERGVVSTCNYDARRYGVRSGMAISSAYKLCPNGVFLRPNFGKYIAISQEINKIWQNYTDLVEKISLDEGFLDVTHSAHLFGGVDAIAKEIKRRILQQTGLTCSVGIGFSMMSAKIASEEKKPDGLFKIADVAALHRLILNRNVRIIYGVGAQTAVALEKIGITTVSHILENFEAVEAILGKHGRDMVQLARGIDTRRVTPEAPAKSLGREHTFQKDITNFDILEDTLLLITKYLAFKIKKEGIFCKTVTLKITYAGMKRISRHASGDFTNSPKEIFSRASEMLAKIDRKPVRLVGIALSGFDENPASQLDIFGINKCFKKENLEKTIFNLQYFYGIGIIKTGREFLAMANLNESGDSYDE